MFYLKNNNKTNTHTPPKKNKKNKKIKTEILFSNEVKINALRFRRYGLL